MTFLRKVLLIPAAALFLTASPLAYAQADNFAPVMATFSGSGAKSYVPSTALNINGYGTIEFWVAATWDSNPGYDPAIMALSGAKGARFTFYVTGDRKALGVQAGPHYDTVPFDFSDGGLHHVAITALGDTTVVMIDGQLQPEALNFGFADVDATSFTIGAIGRFSPFVGEIGQVRIWNEPVEADVLIDFAWKPLADTGANAHPNIDELAGISAFGNPETGGFIFAGDPDDALLASVKPAVFDDSARVAPPAE